ncbi:rubredoxin [Alistipes putredinis]|uniref:rubredoxin n=1 Tax=Alistipes putredinis TaxID=28117 RepID=UPI003AB0F0A4
MSAAPGTPSEEIPDDRTCPVCGVGKSKSEEVEEQPGKRGAAPKRSAPRHFGEPFQKNRGGVYNLRRFYNRQNQMRRNSEPDATFRWSS